MDIDLSTFKHGLYIKLLKTARNLKNEKIFYVKLPSGKMKGGRLNPVSNNRLFINYSYRDFIFFSWLYFLLYKKNKNYINTTKKKKKKKKILSFINY